MNMIKQSCDATCPNYSDEDTVNEITALKAENQEIFTSFERIKANNESLLEAWKKESNENVSLKAKLEVALNGLSSISKNSCCDSCQEAKLVALSTLKQLRDGV